MCGIVGQLNFNGEKINQNLIREMAAKINYRGPDGEGFYFENFLGLGHKRLAIIDLKGGSQPIFNEDGSIVIVFNGEIYNYKDLKEELTSHIFKTNTDTEVIIHLYEKYGEKCLEKLNGDFSFALWDKKKETLFLARDRIGVKPLYYYLDKNKLVFASQLRPILENHNIKKTISLVGLNRYFSYLYNPGEQTIFESVKKLLPGHYIKISGEAGSRFARQNSKFKIQKYWDLQPSKINPEKTEEDYLQEFKNLFYNSVKIRLMSDVPLGVLLSGGMDSSSIVAALSEMGFKSETFAINCGAGIFNELPFAKIIAKKFKTKHHEFEVKPDLVKVWGETLHFFDGPFGNPSALPSYYIAKLVDKHVTVFLSGEGSDEILAGYSWYRVMEEVEKNRLLWRFLPGIKSKIKLAKLTPSDAFASLRTYFSPRLKRRIFSNDLNGALKNEFKDNLLTDYFNNFSDPETLNRAMYVDLKTNLTEDLLLKLDRAGMAFGLEGRVPFLDHRLVEFLANVPYQFKKDKYLLRKTMKGILPEKTLNRTKRGMMIPVDHWLRRDLKDFARDILLQPHPFFNRQAIKKMLEIHFSGKRNFGAQIFGLLSYYLWEEEFKR